MGFLDRRRAKQKHEQEALTAATWSPPARGDCACTEHIDDLGDLAMPFAPAWGEETGGLMTIAELLECEALGVEPTDPAERWLAGPADEGRAGPLHWNLWLGDEARGLYEDEADLQMDESLSAQHGVDEVVWLDREVFHVGAPTLCADGVLAAAARALADPRVRESS